MSRTESAVERGLAPPRRTVYGRAGTPTPTWMWLVQRLSGVLVGPLVVIHAFVVRAPFTVWLSSLLLTVILAHAFVGLWRLAAMRHFDLRTWRIGLTLSLVFVVVVGGFGIGLLYGLDQL